MPPIPPDQTPGPRETSSRYGCEVEGCLAHVEWGDAIHRTSPMGGPFRGRCTKHFQAMGGTPDDLAVIIEDDNDGKS